MDITQNALVKPEKSSSTRQENHVIGHADLKG